MRQVPNDQISLAPLTSATVAVIGYGNQGRSHALNLRDSGIHVIVGQRSGASFAKAEADGWTPVSAGDAAKTADLIIITLPDESASDVFREEIAPRLRAGQTIGFVHGFNIRFGLVTAPPGVNVIMVAPKGPGALLRSLYEQGRGLPSLVAVDRDATGNAMAIALAWAAGIGAARAGVVETTFAAETETDLFGEQVVLCGGVSALIKAAFETLVSAGYDPELAYIECIHELKQVVDLIYLHGLTGMRRRISGTARYGDVSRGPRVIDDHVRQTMHGILQEIRDGSFAREWIAEHRAGQPKLSAGCAADEKSALEQAGLAVRRLWANTTNP